MQARGGHLLYATAAVPLLAAHALALSTRAAPAQAHLDPAQVAWLHVPKTGTSFGQVLISWGCPEHLADFDKSKGALANNFCVTYKSVCPVAHSLCSTHSPINSPARFLSGGLRGIRNWAEERGHFVGMFREPRQRHIAAYSDGQLMSTLGLRVTSGHYKSVLQFAQANSGCMAKMMNGVACNDAVPASERMAERALRVLDHGFAFVGLTEEWSLSVCLFHAMFGGECHQREFKNVRPGSYNKNSPTALSANLSNWTDPYDEPLYSRAKEIFWRNVASYDVTRDTCRDTVCRGAPDAFKAAL